MADLANLTYAISFAVQNNPFGQINNNIQQMQRNLNNASGAANNAARATGNIGQNAQNSTSPIKSLGKAIAGAFVTKKIIDFGKSVVTTGIEGAASLEQYRNTLNVVMGDQKKAAETFKWAVDFANKTPFETDEIVQATVKLQSYGITAQENMSIIGDMAGVMGKSLDQAVEAVADAQTGELERLKEFGITKQQIIDHGNKIMRGKEIVNNKGQITDQKSFNKVLFDLMQKRFKGGMELQANSFKGIMSTISGVFKTSLAKMMGITDEGKVKVGGMFDTIKNYAKGLSDILQKLSDDGTLERIGNGITFVFNAVNKALQGVGKFGEMLSNAFQTGDFYDSFMPMIEKFNDLIYNLFPKEQADKIADAFNEVMVKVDEYGTFFGNLWNDKIIPIWNNAVSWINDTIWPIIKGFFDKISPYIKPIIDNVYLVVTGMINTLVFYFETYFPLIKGIIEGVIKSVSDILAGLVRTLSGILEFIAGVFTGNWSKAWDGIKNIFGGVWDSLVALAKAPLNIVIGLINGAIENINKIKIPDWVPVVGGKSTNIGKIPMLANGGITTGPTHAIIGEGKEQEAVLPLSRLENLMNTGSVDGTSNTNNRMNFSPTINISVNAGADANGTAIAVKKAVQDAVDEMFSTVNLQLGYTNI